MIFIHLNFTWSIPIRIRCISLWGAFLRPDDGRNGGTHFDLDLAITERYISRVPNAVRQKAIPALGIGVGQKVQMEFYT